MMPNPAAGKAGIAHLLAVEHHWPGLPEPGRSAASAHFDVRTRCLPAEHATLFTRTQTADWAQ
jgi:hypothetical protein